jgi:hypothetical protein
VALTADQLAQLRRMISEATEDAGWTDDDIAAIAEANVAADGTYDLRAIAAAIWEMKAAKYVTLANTSESGSSRSLSQIFEHAQAMANYFKNSLTTGDPTAVFPRSTRMVRPTREG